MQWTPAMIPVDQKQLNIAFPTLTMSSSRGEIQNTVWKQLYSVAAGDKLLYSGWGQLCI